MAEAQAVPMFLRLAAEPLRWRLLVELAQSDLRVRELTERVGEPQNLVSYHLRMLRDGGLLSVTRSTHDGPRDLLPPRSGPVRRRDLSDAPSPPPVAGR